MVTASALRSRFLLSLGLLVGGVRGATAQTAPDTTRLKYGEEVTLPSVGDTTLRVQQEQRSLWKLGLNNFLPPTLTFISYNNNNYFYYYYYYARYGLHLAYERKLRDPAWSVLGEVSPALVAYRPDYSPANRYSLALRAQAAGRYYYNRERRLRHGRSMSNFSANYVSVALGAGLGKEFHETPSFFYQNTERRLVTTEVALLYGLQRRLGRYGFVDANVGVAALLVNQPLVALSANVRVGLTLGPQPPKYVEQLASASEVRTLQPTFYAGASLGGYFYQVRYSTQYPYPAPVVKTSPTETQTTTYPGIYQYQDGYGSYAQYVSAGPIPYVYAGYYLRPRLALQLGFQYGETFDSQPVGTVFTTPDGTFAVPNQTLTERGLAVPLLVRYALTRSFLRRLQFNAVGGVVPVWSMVRFQEYAIVNRQVTSQETFGFQRRAFGLHATLGFDVSYAFGRRRRLEATAEVLLNKDAQTLLQVSRNNPAAGAYLAGGSSFGLRYRFRYR